MTQLYTRYAELYHKMYQSFIDYEAEYLFYKNLIDKIKGKSVLEVGCGTGQLAKRFIADNYTYTGIDISTEMLAYAKAHLPEEHFHQMDMREIKLDATFDVVLITARSTSYLLTNNDVMSAFQSIKKVSHQKTFLIFDFIDAKTFIPAINENKAIKHEVLIDNIKYKRESLFKRKVSRNWNWTWRSVFHSEENGKYKKLGTDKAELRAFTSDEMEIFLKLNGFDVLEVLQRKVYAFDTLVIVAQVNNTFGS